MAVLRIMMIGDVVGEPGLKALESRLPLFIKENKIDLVVANGENAYGGFGLTAPLMERLLASGVNIVSSGNHIWEQREFWPVLESEQPVLRPLNYPEGSPGKGWLRWDLNSGAEMLPAVYVVNLQGREFMTPLDCPFKAFDLFEKSLLGETNNAKNIILVDMHAESSREKESLAYYLDGRASVIAGTHTHVQTADERILPKGTAYITDLGMCGNPNGVIGMDAKICLERAKKQVLYRMEVAESGEEGSALIQGIIAEIDSESAKALSVRRVSI